MPVWLVLFLPILIATVFAQSTPEKPVLGPIEATVPVIMTARTPWGEASIEMEPGTKLQIVEITDGRASVRKGPFTGWVAVGKSSLATKSPEQNAANPAPVSSRDTPSVQDAPTPSLSGERLMRHAELIPVVALVVFSLAITIAWIRVRRKVIALTATPDKAPAEKPAKLNLSKKSGADFTPKKDDKPNAVFPISERAPTETASIPVLSPVPKTVVPSASQSPEKTLPIAEVSEPDEIRENPASVLCPICGVELPADALVLGRNVCPKCSGAFVCE